MPLFLWGGGGGVCVYVCMCVLVHTLHTRIICRMDMCPGRGSTGWVGLAWLEMRSYPYVQIYISGAIWVGKVNQSKVLHIFL